MLKRAKFLLASVLLTFLCTTSASALSTTSLEQISAPSDSIEINDPEEGYDFDATFLSKNQELQYQATITNDSDKDISIDSVTLDNANYDFLSYSFSGIEGGETLQAGEDRAIILTVSTNSNDTQTVADNYRLHIAYTEIDKPSDNPDTAATKIIPIIAIIAITGLAAVLIFAKTSKRRIFVLALAIPTLGIFAFSQNSNAKGSEDFEILGKIRFVNTYTVTVDPDGGIYDGSENPTIASLREGEIFHVNEATRSTYTFQNWEVNPGELDSNNNIEIHSDTLIRAIWDENHFTLTINPNGGSYKGVSEISTFTYREGATVEIVNPERSTYDFTGWSIEPSTTFSGSITMDKDYTFTANWEEIYYNLTIDPNGGTHDGHNSSYTQSIRAGSKVCLNAPTRDTYNFTGWVSDEARLDGSSCFYIDQDTTFTASWDEVFYNLTINPNGGTYGTHTETFTQSRRANTQVCLDSPTRATYSFTGWTTNDIELDSQSCFTITKDSIFTANWEEIYYNLTINPNGGVYDDKTEAFTKSYRAGTKVDLLTPSYTGHDFVNWTKNETETYQGDSININENIALVANWDDIYFDVTIDPNGGKYHNSTEIWTGRVKYGDSVDLSGTTWADNEITHWTQNDEEIPADTTTVEIYEDTDFVAFWQSTIFHTVTIIPNGGTYDDSTEPKQYLVRQGTDYTFLEATRDDDYAFEDWYLGDEVRDDNKYTQSKINVMEDVTFIANWFKIVARIERTQEVFPSIMAAHEAANPENITDDIITLLVNTEEVVTNEKQVTLDLNNHVVTGYLTNTASGKLTLINGEINNYESPIVNEANPNGAAVINNGVLIMGIDDYEEDDTNNKEPLIDNQNIRIIGTEVGLQQNNKFYFYDGFIEGVLGLVGGYDGSPWYRNTFDGIIVYYFPFVTHNNTKDCQHVELSNADKAVSKTSVHGDIYYYNLQDNINTSALTGYQIYAVRDFDASYAISVPEDGRDIVFDIVGYEVNLGDNVTIDKKTTIKDSKTGDEAGLLTSSKTIVNNSTLNLENVNVSALTANALIKNNGTLEATNSTISSNKGIVLYVTEPGTTVRMDDNSYIKSESTSPAISNDSTDFTLVSGNVTGTECAVQNNNGKTFSMTGGNIFSTYRGICNSQNGTINISNGTITTSYTNSNSAIYSNYGVVNISGGTISSTSTATNYNTLYTIDGYNYGLNITGGTITAKSSANANTAAIAGNYNTTTIDGPDVVISATNTGNGSVHVIYKGTSTVNIKQGTLTAEANSGQANISGTGECTFNISGGTMTAHSVSNNAFGIDSLYRYGSTVNMSGGNISATTDSANKLGIGLSANTLNVSDGYVHGSNYGIYGTQNGYTANVTIGINDETVYNGQDGIAAKPIVQGGTYAISNGYINFYDGILKGGATYIDNPAYIRAIPDGTYLVVTDLEDPVEQDCWLEIDEDYLQLEDGTTLNSLSKAFSLANDGETITVIADKTTQAVIAANQKNLTLDLNGHSLNYTQSIANSGTLTIEDGSSDKSGKITNNNTSVKAVTNNGTLYLNSGTISGYDCPVQNTRNNTFTMNGGSISAQVKGACNQEGTMYITGGSITTTNTASNNAIYSNYGSVHISGGTFSSTNTSTSSSTLYTIEGYNYALNITGGTVTATSSASGTTSAIAGSYGSTTIDGPNVEIEATNTNNGSVQLINRGTSTVNVKQGTLTAEANTGESYISSSGECTFNISGGTMTSHSVSNNARGFSALYRYGSTVNMSGGNISAITDNPSRTGIALSANTIKITDGYIYGNSYGILGLQNGYTANTTIGTNDNTIYNGQDGVAAKPIIQGGINAITNGYILFYDGILKGGSAYIDDEKYIKAIPDGASRVIENYSDPVEQDCWLEEDEDYLQLEDGSTYNSLTAALANSKSTETITVIRDASTEAVLPAIEKDITLDLNGHTLFYTQTLTNNNKLTIKDSSEEKNGTLNNNNASVRTINNYGTLTLESGNIQGQECVIYNNSGYNFTMNGGSISAVQKALCSYGTATINDGNITVTSSAHLSAIYTYTSTIYINGGTISAINTGNNSTNTTVLEQYSGQSYIYGGTLEAISGSTGTTTVFGSSYGSVTIDGADVVASATNTSSAHTTVIGKSTATIYIKQGTLIAEANSGEAHISSSGENTYYISGGTMTSHSVSNNASGINSLYRYGSNVTMTGGSISATTDSANKLGIGISVNTAKITDGYVYGSTYGILGIQNGYISNITIGENDGTIYNGQDGVAAKPVIVGGTYGVSEGNVSFYDGTLKGQIDGYYDRNIKAIADQSYMHQSNETIDGDEYVVKYLAEEDWLAKIGDTQYKSIQAAINASSENDTIELLKDNYVFNAIKVPADKKFTLDIYGYEIITGAYIENNGNMTIINSQKATSNPTISYRETNRFIQNKAGATLRIDDLDIRTTNTAIVNDDGGSVTLNDVTITSTSNANTITSAGTLTITNLTLTSAGSYGIYQTKGQLTLSDSTISAYDAAVNVSGGTATIDNVTLDSTHNDTSAWYYGFYLSTGSATISNSTLLDKVYNTNGTLTIANSSISHSGRYNYPALTNTGANANTVIDNTTIHATSINQSQGYSWTGAIDNGGTLTIQNQSKVELAYENTTQNYTLSGVARVISNSGTLNINDSSIVNTDFQVARNTGRTNGIYNAGGTVNFANSTIELSRYESYGIYNESGTTNLESGSIKAGGYSARGLWVKNGSINMGEAEPTDSQDYGQETAHVDTTTPYIEALGSNNGIGVTLETGNFRFYDGKILQKNEVGPAVQANGVDKATVTDVEYLYQPEKHQDENGNYYFILEFMR